MTTLEFLARLRSLDVHLSIDGQRLQVNAPDNVLTPELRTAIVKRMDPIKKCGTSGMGKV